MEPQTQKQQITDIIRNADNVVITTSKDPDIDQTAAAIALTHIITKMGKRADAVISGDRPQQIEFLGTKQLSHKFSGIRDFVISINTIRTEADKLKYVPEGKALNVYITPYNSNYSSDDVSFHYGDFHADAVVALGVSSRDQLDNEIAGQQELLAKAKLITINAGNPPTGQAGPLSWHEPNASSVCELLMSLTEALQSGLVDDQVATALLTGIMAKTEHFTNAATTPKVMTMAAQLMAAGAKQPEILKHLQAVVPAKPGPSAPMPKPDKKAKERGEMEPAKEEQLAHHPTKASKKAEPKQPTPALPVKDSRTRTAPLPKADPAAGRPPQPAPRPLPVQPAAPLPFDSARGKPISPPPTAPVAPTVSRQAPPAPGQPPSSQREMVVEPPSTPEPPAARTSTTIQPPRPGAVSQVAPESRLGDNRPATGTVVSPSIPPLAHGPTPTAPATPVSTAGVKPAIQPTAAGQVPPTTPTQEGPGSSPPPPPHIDIEAARKAVEEATKNTPVPPTPANPPPQT